jgi:hypothetical protein
VSTLYEILELPSGEIVLQRAGEDTEPLIRIRFSDQARAYMLDASLDVAKAMVEAGVKVLSDINQDAADDGDDEQPRRLH